MNRLAWIVGVSTCLWAAGLGWPNHALAGPPVGSATKPATPEPPSGRGLYGAGIFGVSFGIFNIGYGIPLITIIPDAPVLSAIPIAFGASFIAMGAVGIHYGKRRRKVWRAWEQDPTAPLLVLERKPPKPPHVPWLIVGGVITPVGIATMATMIPTFTDPVLNTPNFAYWVVGWGAVSTAAGLSMLITGGVKHHQARHGTGHAARLELMPTGWANRDGFGLGVAGRM